MIRYFWKKNPYIHSIFTSFIPRSNVQNTIRSRNVLLRSRLNYIVYAPIRVRAGLITTRVHRSSRLGRNRYDTLLCRPCNSPTPVVPLVLYTYDIVANDTTTRVFAIRVARYFHAKRVHDCFRPFVLDRFLGSFFFYILRIVYLEREKSFSRISNFSTFVSFTPFVFSSQRTRRYVSNVSVTTRVRKLHW